MNGSATGDDLTFQVLSNYQLEAPSTFTGLLQVAKLPTGSQSEESVFDESAGVYATGAAISGSVSSNTGSYTLQWAKAGATTSARSLVMFALPHHVESFDFATSSATTTVQLQTTTKGLATAVLRDAWTMVEESLPVTIGFAPWNSDLQRPFELSATAIQTINEVAAVEVSQDFDRLTNLDSMYFSGKV